nr:MAG TPA: hypothetical protein [Caudoviricetes sp.]
MVRSCDSLFLSYFGLGVQIISARLLVFQL